MRLSKALFTMLIALPLIVSAAQAEPVRLLAFGDSLTQGYGLPQAEGFVPQLEGWLNAHGADVIVVNGGVSGDTSAGGASRIAWSLTDDIDAVLVALGGNDMLRGLSPEETRANLDAILGEIQSRGLPVLLIGMSASENFGSGYKQAFDALYPNLAQAWDVPLFPDFLAGLAEVGDRQTVVREYLQSDGIHPNAAGVAKVIEVLGPAVLDLLSRTAN